MGGDATFTGTTYQARVIAFLYVHVLARMRLGWFAPADDTPLAVSGETDGPGDDARLEFGSKLPPAEVQAKHGLTGGAELDKVVDRLRRKTPEDSIVPVVLTVDRHRTSRWILSHLPTDLGRLRSGRSDALRPETERIRDELVESGASESVLHALYVAPVDVDSAQDPEAKHAFSLLQTSILDDPDQAAAAWAVLVDDAAEICARRERRTRKDLVGLLQGANIAVRPPAKDDPWHRDLDFTKQLMAKRLFEPALAQLKDVEQRLNQGKDVGPHVRYRFFAQRAIALVNLSRGGEALSDARRALEYEPAGLEALRAACQAAMMDGDLAAADGFAERAVEAHPDDGSAWGVKAQAAAARGNPIPRPPEAVANSIPFKKALAQIALVNGDQQAFLELSADLLREEERSPTILFNRANFLIDAPSSSVGISDEERFAEVERLATEVIDALAGSPDPLLVKCLVLRSSARDLLGRAEEAREDLASARKLQADDVDALAHEAQARVRSGDLTGARELLRYPSVEDVPELVALRARLAALSDAEADARRDLQSAIAGAERSRNPDRIRLAVVDVALLLDDFDLAEGTLAGVSPEREKDPQYLAMKGRLAFARDRIEDGVAAYREGERLHPDARPLLLSELGSNLLQAGRGSEAVEVFSELRPPEIPAEALRTYAAALIETDSLQALQQLLEALPGDEPLPSWALAAATELAVRQEDPDAAIRHLGNLVESGQGRVGARVELARLLLETGRPADARPHVQILRDRDDLTAIQRMQVAQLLHALGQEDEALPLAHEAFRTRPGDARINRAFIMMTFMGKGSPPSADVVGPDTYVRLEGGRGEVMEYMIVSGPDVDPRRNELSLEDAEIAGLVGKKVGDRVERVGGLEATEWGITAVLPRIVWDAQQAALHYEDRFPGEPFFITSFKMAEPAEVRDLAPLVSSLEARKRKAEQAFAMLRDQGFPLGMIAELLGVSISEVMESLATDQAPVATPLLVEWEQPADYDAARALARGADELVLTRSALKTLSDLRLLPVVSERCTLVAPRSLLDELRAEVVEADRLVSDGHSVISREGDGLRMVQLDPGDPSLVSRAEDLRLQLGSLVDLVELNARPVERIRSGDSEPGSLRQIVGRSSHDAVVLAQHREAAMLADDLGLRRLQVDGAKAASCSTITLVEALADEGEIAGPERERLLVELAVRRYTHIRPTRELIASALRRATEIGNQGLRAVMGTLGSRGVAPADAARLTMEAVRSQIMAEVQVVSTGRIVELALEEMCTVWPVRLCVQLIARAAAEAFSLYPQASIDVRQACKKFLAAAEKSPVAEGSSGE